MSTGLKVQNWWSTQRKLLRGFRKIELSIGIVIRRLPIFSGEERPRESSQLTMIGRAGAAMRDDHGKSRLLPIIKCTLEAEPNRSSDAVIMTLRAAHP